MKFSNLILAAASTAICSASLAASYEDSEAQYNCKNPGPSKFVRSEISTKKQGVGTGREHKWIMKEIRAEEVDQGDGTVALYTFPIADVHVWEAYKKGSGFCGKPQFQMLPGSKKFAMAVKFPMDIWSMGEFTVGKITCDFKVESTCIKTFESDGDY